MIKKTLFILFGLLSCSHLASSIWQCTQDSDCSDLQGSICSNGSCQCVPGTESVLGGTLCADIAPYHTSPCVENHQCSRLFTNFECRQSQSGEGGNCACQPNHHYFRGRCWRSVGYGQTCNLDEECIGAIRDPYSFKCDGTCRCADGYYERQRGECRRIGSAVGEGCVIDQDCRFENGACDIDNFVCYDINDPPLDQNATEIQNEMALQIKMAGRQHEACDAANPCVSPFQCLSGYCVCPTGYYANENATLCYAELGSPSTPEICVGLLALVIDGICTCRPNFFYEENMRDCTKVTRRITDSCVYDRNCHTFGAKSICGEPQDPWPFRECECDLEESTWDTSLNICRLFAGIGEACEVDSDCLAGELEIQCRVNDDGLGVCVCPDDTLEYEGLCLTTGKVIGDSCQHTIECTGTPDTVCEEGICLCDSGYQQVDDFCAPTIGGFCTLDSDCVIENTKCVNSTDGYSCQCDDSFMPYNDECWPELSHLDMECAVAIQCQQIIGEKSNCTNNMCSCINSYHLRDGRCWPMINLFEPCSRSSECFLQGMSEAVVCRNSLCQCDFQFPYSEETRTCTNFFTSAAVTIQTTTLLLATALTILYN